MKRKQTLLAFLMAVAMIATAATGCSKEIDTSVPETTTKATTTTSVTTTTTAATTTTTEATTTTTAATTKATTAATKATTKATTAATTKATTTAATTQATTAATTAAPVPAGSVGKYVYNSLTDEEKTIYNEIVAAIKNFSTTCTFKAPHDGAMVTKVYQHVFFQEPELFWFQATTASYSGSTSSIPLQYRYSQADTATMQKQLDAAVNAIIAKFPANASVVTKLTIAHDTIITGTTFSKDDPQAKNAFGPLAGDYGQCEGYAKALAYVCNKLGIDNVRVTGSKTAAMAPTDTHAWNKVLVNGKWYNIDLTWDDPVAATNPADFVIHNYMLVPDAQINGISHFVDGLYKNYPVANSLDSNYFVVNGMYATKAADAVSMMQTQLTNSAKAKKPVAEIKCSTKEVFDAAVDALITKGQIINQQTTANAASPNKIKGLAGDYNKYTLTIRINLTY